MKEVEERELASLRSQIANLEAETERIRFEIENYNLQKDQYERLVKLGFFTDQNRLLARERFNIMREISDVLTARYSLRSAELENPADFESVNHKIVRSPISIDIEAIDDTDVFRFVYLLNYSFPGHLSIKDIVITRERDVDPDVLKSIGTGTPEVMVRASMNVDWRTMANQSQINEILGP